MAISADDVRRSGNSHAAAMLVDFAAVWKAASTPGALCLSLVCVVGDAQGADTKNSDVYNIAESRTLQETLQKLDVFIDQVFAKKRPIHGKQQLYLAVEEAVLEGHSRILLKRFLSRMQERIFFIFQTSLCPQLSSEVQFLRCSANAWLAFRDALHSILQVLAYFERHVMTYTNQESLLNVSYSLWFVFQQRLLPSFNSCIATALLGALEQHRNGDRTWESDLQVNLHMLLTLGTYREVFEEQLLQASWRYYLEEGQRLAGGGAAALERYCMHVQHRLQEENLRVSLFFAEYTREPLLQVVRKALVEEHLGFLADTNSLKVYLYEENHTQLHSLAVLLGQVQRRDLLNQQFQRAAREMGTELLQTLQHPPPTKALQHQQEGADGQKQQQVIDSWKRKRLFIRQLLTLQSKHERAWTEAFNCDPVFSLSMKEAWEKFLNRDPELMKLATHALAKYCDHLLKRSSVGLSAEEVEREMLRIMVVFRHLQGKDYFEEFYRSDLCKRLLMRRSANEDSERSMVQKLKEECGQQYTSNLESMFKDIQVSRQTMATFNADEEAQRQVKATGIEFDVAVCATGMWPQQSAPDELQYPPPMQQLHNLFATFYRSKHAGRTLSWTPRLGTCDLLTQRPAGPWPPFVSKSKTSSSSSSSSTSSGAPLASPVSTSPSSSTNSRGVDDRGVGYSNSKNGSNCASSQEETVPGLNSNITRNNDKETSTARKRNATYLLKVSEMQALILLLFNDRDMATTAEVETATGITGEELQRQLVALYVNRTTRILLRHRAEATEEYYLNFDFESKLKRLQVIQIQLATQPKEEMEKAEEHVSEDRNHHVDACIVRLMKTRQRLRHSYLVAEVLKQIRFTCEPTMVKKRIESLLSREYIRRDVADRTLYKYVA